MNEKNTQVTIVEGDQVKEEEITSCCFCGMPIMEPFTNNPAPANTQPDARCCSWCDWHIVMPARMGKKPKLPKNLLAYMEIAR